MKIVASLLSVCIASAAAFSPSTDNRLAPPSALSLVPDDHVPSGKYAELVSTDGPINPAMAGYSPWGVKMFEDKNADFIEWFENAEIKHGRVGMVAAVGYYVQKMGIHFPLYLGPGGSNTFHPESGAAWYLSKSADVTFSDIANAAPLDALKMIPAFGYLQILIACGMFELTAVYRQQSKPQADRIPGDYGFDPLGFTKQEGGLESASMKKMRTRELMNGRLGM